MAALPSGSMISFKDAWQNIFSTTDDPPIGETTATSLEHLSITLASSSVTVADRDAMVGQRHGVDEWWGSNYPSSQITDVLIKDTSNAVETEFVDGETARVTFSQNTTNAQHTVTLRNAANTIKYTNTVTPTGGSAPYSATTDFPSLALDEADGYYAKITLNDFNNVNSPTFYHYDQIAGSITGVSTQTIANNTVDTVITHGLSTSAGTLEGRSWIFGLATDGDNEARTPVSSTSTDSPVVTYTGTGTFPVSLTQYGAPSNARNYDAATGINVVINYTTQILSVVSTSYQLNHGGTPTLQATSRGVSGTMRLGYGAANDNTTYTGYSNETVSTVKISRDYSEQFIINHASNTGTGLTTYYPKAHYTTTTETLTAGSAIKVAPTFSYSVPASISINVNTTRVLNVSSVIGNGASVVISSSPSAGNGTDTATLTPLAVNAIYTITYDGAANYSQTQDYSRTVTVNPTVSVALSADQGDYPITDENGNTITSAKHGISPTIFTATPTVVGSTQTTFLWTLTDLPLETSYTTATAGLVKFKMTDNGSVLRDLTVSGNSTSGTGAFTVTTQSITKSFDNQPIIDTTDTILRRHSSYVINFQCDYIKNVKLRRKNPANSAYYDLVGSTATDIGNDFVDEDVGPSFTIPSNATLSTNGRNMVLADFNYTSLESLEIGNSNEPPDVAFKIYDRLAAVPTSVAQYDGNESVGVTWTDGNSNSSGNKVYIYSDAGSTQIAGSPFTYTANANDYLHSHTLTTGTSRVARYFKVSGINASSEEGVLSDVTSAAYVHPDCSYTTSGDKSINVDTTTTYKFETINGYSFEGDITSDPDIGSADNISSTSTTVTMTPGTANDVYTITYENVGAAISQTATNQTDELTVNPTVSVALTDNQAGATSYPINDEHSNTITVATHGYAPTIFTATPTVVGANVDTYAWTLTGLPLESGSTTSTVGAVLFKMTNDGTATPSLEVSGNDTDATAGFSVTTVSVTKSFNDAVTSDKLRHGTTFTVSSIDVSYITRMEVWRQYDANTSHVEQVCDVEATAASINFGLTGGLAPYDDTARYTYLKDADNGDIVVTLGDHKIWQELPVIDGFSASATTTLGELYLEWTTSYASVNITVNTGTNPGAQSADGNTTITGLGNNTARTYTLTATNANGETTTSVESATTIIPSITVGTPTATSWDYGDIGVFTVPITKNFHNAIIVYMGKSMSASQAGGTIYTTLSTQGDGVTTFDASFNKTNFGGTDFGAIVDFKAYSAAAGGFINDNAATFSDFDAPDVATGTSVDGETGNSLRTNWTWPATPWTNLQISGSEADISPGLGLTSFTNGTTTSYINTGLSSGQEYDYTIRTSYTRIADGVNRVKNTDTSIFSGTTIGWTSVEITVIGSSFPTNHGQGWDNPEEAYLGAAPSTADGTLHYITTQTLGTNTVNLNRAVDGQDWEGGDDYYATAESDAVFRISSGGGGETAGDVLAVDYYTSANVLPKSPTGFGSTANTMSTVTITWNNISSIEDNYIVYRRAGSTAPTTSTYDAVYTVAANSTSYANTGLAANTQYSWSVYAKRGTTYSGRTYGTRTTLNAPQIDSMSAAASATNGIIDITWTTTYVTTVVLKSSASVNMTSPTTLVNTSVGSWMDRTYNNIGLGDGVTRYYQLTGTGNGGSALSSVVSATTNAASTSWTPPSNFSMEDNAFAHTYRNKYADVTNGSTSTTTTISATNGLTLKLSLTGYPTGTSGYTSSKNITIGTSNDRIYIRFKYIHPKDNASASSVVTFLNNSVSDTCTVDITTSGEI